MLYVATMFLVATQLHAVGIIMHDATHYRLFRNRTANDLVSDLFCAFPLLLTTNRYRYYHLLHHRNVNSEADPYWTFFRDQKDWTWPKTVKEALSVLIRDLTGLTARNEMKMIVNWTPFANHFSRRAEPPRLSLLERLSFYGFVTVMLSLVAYFNLWFHLFFLWYVPLVLLMMPLVRLRTVAEHIGIPGRTGDNATRHVDGTWFERVFICPRSINYHVAHHLFPMVPLYNLPAFHRRSLQEPEYREFVHVKESYLSLDKNKGVLGELLSKN